MNAITPEAAERVRASVKAATQIVNQRCWGQGEDGQPYVIGMTVAELRNELSRFKETDEVCVAVCQKKNWNGGGLLGMLKAVEDGSTGQIWLKARVLDPTLE